MRLWPGSSRWDYAHRRTGAGDLYFVRNPNAYAVKEHVTFRATGSPQLWDAVTGAVRGVAYTTEYQTTTVPLEMPPFGSIFVMFLRGGDKIPVVSEATALPVALGPRWTVSFEAGRGAPASTTMTELTDWSKSADPGIRYFFRHGHLPE